jgi:hypothetical protein
MAEWIVLSLVVGFTTTAEQQKDSNRSSIKRDDRRYPKVS